MTYAVNTDKISSIQTIFISRKLEIKLVEQKKISFKSEMY